MSKNTKTFGKKLQEIKYSIMYKKFHHEKSNVYPHNKISLTLGGGDNTTLKK